MNHNNNFEVKMSKNSSWNNLLCGTRKCQSKKSVKNQWKHLTEEIDVIIINSNIIIELVQFGSYPKGVISYSNPNLPKFGEKKDCKKNVISAEINY